MRARFAHTNLIALDCRALAAFYERVFGCTVVTPEQDLSGSWIEKITAVPGAEIRLVHLRLPGLGAEGPTLEIIQYSSSPERLATVANRPGFGHIAFYVDDVEEARRAVVEAGGGRVGEVVSVTLPGRGTMTEVYVTDPEGNIIELQIAPTHE